MNQYGIRLRARAVRRVAAARRREFWDIVRKVLGELRTSRGSQAMHALGLDRPKQTPDEMRKARNARRKARKQFARWWAARARHA